MNPLTDEQLLKLILETGEKPEPMFCRFDYLRVIRYQEQLRKDLKESVTKEVDREWLEKLWGK